MADKNLFFLAIIPPEPIKSAVMAFKKEVEEKFGSKAALRSPPHITLHMPFQWRKDREDQLREIMSGFRFQNFPLEVEIKNFDFFEPRVVYVDVVKSEVLTKFQKEMVGYVKRQLNIFNADYKNKPYHPHMTIGFRDLKKSVFPEVKKEFQDREYQARFEVSEICLLRHNGKTWDEWFYW